LKAVDGLQSIEDVNAQIEVVLANVK